MTDLIACLSTGKGSWNEVNSLIKSENWERIILITNSFGKENYKGEATLVVVNPDVSLDALTKEIKSALGELKLRHEVALNFISGSGKEHMALLSALLQLGVGIRLVYAENNTMKSL